MSFDELGLLQGALNEICNAVRELGRDSEFETRLGATREEGRALLREIKAALATPPDDQ